MRKRKTIKGVGLVLAAVLCTVLLLTGVFEYRTRYRISDIDFSVSPDGTYSLSFQSIGEPDFPYGYSHARLVLRHDGKTAAKYTFDVANDGGLLRADNWNVSWEDDCVKVTVSGEEQPDALYTLFFDGRTGA